MKKLQEQPTIYIPTSKNEIRLLGAIKDRDIAVFGVAEIRSLTEWKDSRIHNTLRSLERKGLIVRLKRNSYTLESFVTERSFEIATEVVKPSYISFWTALSYYGFTEQQVRVVQLVSTKQFDDMTVGPYKIQVTTFGPGVFFGYIKMDRFVIAEKEKALVDSLYNPEKCGGLDELAKCLSNSWERIDQGKLGDYTLRFGNNSLTSRMGYLVETLGLRGDGLTGRLIRHRSKGYVKLSPGDQKIIGYNNRWRVIVNHEIETEEIR